MVIAQNIRSIDGRPPEDRETVVILKTDNIRSKEFIVVTFVSVVGIFLAVICLVFNVYNRKIK